MLARHLTLCAVLLHGLVYGGGVFWTDRGASQLKRMNFDGSALQTITLSGAVTSPGSNVRGIAVDVSQNLLFWADNGADRLLRANLDGSSSAIQFTITGGNSFPADVRLYPPDHDIYWCDQLRNRIQRMKYDVTVANDVVPNAAPTGPYFMDLDPAAGKIYWGDFEGGSIYRANLADGSGRETLLTGNNNTRGVRIDIGAGMLYWINRDDKKVHRCPLSAFAAGTIPLTHPAVQTLYTNLDTPHGLELDIPARKLYWADTGGNSGVGTGDRAVSRGDFDGSSAMEILATGSEPWDVDLDRRCSNYSEWRMRCFRRDALSEVTDPSADPDGDHLPNALEYAYDLSPLHLDATGTPIALVTFGPVVPGEYPALQFRRRAGTSDLTYHLQSSSDLVSWTGSLENPATVELLVTPLGSGMEEVRVRLLEVLEVGTSRFLRLNVELEP